MIDIPTLPGVTATSIETPRLSTRVLFSGPEDGTPVLFIHGNASNATYWEETMVALPAGFRGIAPDLRGYGGADRAKLVDATRGSGDWVADAIALMDQLGHKQFHLAGHSLGGGVCWGLMRDHADRLLSVTLAATASPYGFGGTKGVDGQPCYADFAGSGGGVVNAAFVQAIADHDRSDAPNSPRDVMNKFYWKPPFRAAREEELLSGLLSEHTGPQQYAGDFVASANWPNVAPGVYGPINALSPKYTGDVSKIWASPVKPPVLWVYGQDDQIVSDNSLFDIGTLGAFGIVPGWPGADVFPSQPMISQTRDVLAKYAAGGGSVTTLALKDCGHTPYLEYPQEFNTAFHALLTGG
ncbi:MAG: alpha/beta hydrolase [Chloroflexi bacterium]|nr:alpha/beta hydrolase [Chloroflexota bacterium]MBV6435982.1 2-succinyl-6-hydroxy-2,4-cyclohexadiene-1-carboxylate synthase [Anaerolineae bacterium]MDL1914593.1 alpha/beta hydrolase [Anaerolineae bacterium CFX4]OQY85836.1 MAG: alpha/beta hydrolase [Anaerolineae bacterium UTCFX5]MCC6567575.1 alpha/beta hydrolase [Chloroflexota bacterium]